MITLSQHILKKCPWAGKILSDVVATHSEEAAFLWLLRERGLYSPHYRLDDFIELDERIEGHLQGVRLAGKAGLEICDEVLELEDAGEVFAFSVTAIGNQNDKRIEKAVNISCGVSDLSAGLISALGWLPWQCVQKTIKHLLASGTPAPKSIAIAAMAVRRRDPGAELKETLESSDQGLKVRSLHALGLLGKRNLVHYLSQSLSDNQPLVRYMAARSGSILGDKACIETLYHMLFEELPWKDEICSLVFRRLGTKGGDSWQALYRDPQWRREAVVAAGAIGDPALVPWLIEQMAEPNFARVAGEAFAMITGAHFEHDQLWGEQPASTAGVGGEQSGQIIEEQPPLEEQPRQVESGLPKEMPLEDEDLPEDTGPDDDLYWPNIEAINAWWTAKKGDFQKGNRYLLGLPISAAAMHKVLAVGFQRQRAAAALELSILDPIKPLIEVRSPLYRR